MTFTQAELTQLHRLLLQLATNSVTRELAQPLRSLRAKIAKALVEAGNAKS